MFTSRQLAELAERKRLLMAEAALHRQVVTAQARRLGDALGWLQPAQRAWRAGRPLLSVVTPALLWFLSRRAKASSLLFSSALAGLRVARAWLLRGRP